MDLTPLKINMSPKKGTISIGNTSSNHHFSGDMSVFTGVEFSSIFCLTYLFKKIQKGDDGSPRFQTSIEEPDGFRQRSYCRLGSDIAAEFQNL